VCQSCCLHLFFCPVFPHRLRSLDDLRMSACQSLEPACSHTDPEHLDLRPSDRNVLPFASVDSPHMCATGYKVTGADAARDPDNLSELQMLCKAQEHFAASFPESPFFLVQALQVQISALADLESVFGLPGLWSGKTKVCSRLGSWLSPPGVMEPCQLVCKLHQAMRCRRAFEASLLCHSSMDWVASKRTY